MLFLRNILTHFFIFLYKFFAINLTLFLIFIFEIINCFIIVLIDVVSLFNQIILQVYFIQYLFIYHIVFVNDAVTCIKNTSLISAHAHALYSIPVWRK